MGASGTEIASTETPAPSRRPKFSVAAPVDPGFAALRRAARAAIVIPPVLAFTLVVLHGGQIVIFAVFVAGAASPADDILDLGIGALMVHLLGWHWEFLPSFLAKLIPGVDLVPFWTWRWQMSIANRSKLPSGKKVVRNPQH